MEKAETYQSVLTRLASLLEGEQDAIARMATIACEVFQAFPLFHWVGFYRVVEPGVLKVGPYQGGHGCLRIAVSRGVCGACVRRAAVQVENDVRHAADHIACSSETQAEMVVPVFDAQGMVRAVLDVDATQTHAFDAVDVRNLEAIAAMVTQAKPETRVS